MCSIYLDKESQAFTEDSAKNVKAEEQFCTKCGLPAVITLRTDDIYCRDCFMVRATHRFRCEFGKSRLIRDNETALVAYSGGRNSCAMVHLIQEGLSKRAHKKLRFIPEIVFIDEYVNLQIPESSERRIFLFSILSKLKDTALKYYIFTLEQVFDKELCPVASDDDDEVLEKLVMSDKTRLKMLMQSTGSKTAQDSLRFLLRKELLVRIARQMQYGKILLGDNASCLAACFLSSVVQGRGAQVPFEMGFSDERYKDVTFLRPLREFTETEIDLYSTISNIKHLSLSENGPEVTSIEKLSKQFVGSLQAEHGNTLAIICRTGEKLEMPEDEAANKRDRCALCQGSLDNISSNGSASAVGAIEFSRSVCSVLRREREFENNTSYDDRKTEESSHTQEQVLGTWIDKQSSVQLLSVLCYGCKLAAREMDDVRKLPHSILQRAKDRMEREKIRKNIEEFLLDDSEMS